MLIKTENTDLGLVTIDHRNAGGPPPVGMGSLLELPTYTCTHCQNVVVMNPERIRPRITCRGCKHMICDNCATTMNQTGKCRTFAQVIDEYLNAVDKQQNTQIITGV